MMEYSWLHIVSPMLLYLLTPIFFEDYSDYKDTENRLLFVFLCLELLDRYINHFYDPSQDYSWNHIQHILFFYDISQYLF